VKLKDRVAIVTGGGGNIGREICLLFAREGAKIVVAQRSAASAQKACREIEVGGGEALFVETDISDYAKVANLVRRSIDRFGKIDILINNASITGSDAAFVPFLELDLESDWRRIVDVNLTGTFICSQQVAAYMAERGRGGVILNISSVAGVVPTQWCASYGVSKAGINMLTQCMAGELQEHDIRVNCLSPGPIREESDEFFDRAATSRAGLLTNRFGRPNDVALAALFLVSDEAEFINGQIISADGGISVCYRNSPRPRRGTK
jgi:3-oxoacyl-[acyl-carrier protein] reductase